ncbi:MAG: prephenate dehydrogenase [Chloroflexi bacterium]|nr:prephenate dehydrogenase [Chloroflexota bacterium]
MKVTLVGLGMVSLSVGLALKQHAGRVSVTGHDPDADRVREARRRGAIDKGHWNLLAACDGADLVFLDLPGGEAFKAMRVLASELTGQVVVLNNQAIQRAAAQWMRRTPDADVQFVGGHLLLSFRGEREPAAEWLRDAPFYLIAGENAAAWALERCSELAGYLGAQVIYIDAEEHDGLMAAAEQLPLAAAFSLVMALRQAAGWRERARCLGPGLEIIVALLDTLDPKAVVDDLLANGDNLLRWLDLYAVQLAQTRQLLVDNDREALEQRIAEAMEACRQAGAGSQESTRQDTPGPWRSLFLGSWGRGPSR